jgi:hypothetical protein
MSEKPESDEFEEEDAEVDVDHIMRDVDSQRRRAPKGTEPAWRRLERVMEERRTAELLSDFDDYEIRGEGARSGGEADDDEGIDEDRTSDDKHHKKKKGR